MKPTINYDERFDILRIHFGSNEPASYEEVANGIYIRTSDENDKIIGLELHGIKGAITPSK